MNTYLLVLTIVIRPWFNMPEYVAYAEAVDANGKKYVYDAHYSIWKDSPEDTYWGVEDEGLRDALNALI